MERRIDGLVGLFVALALLGACESPKDADSEPTTATTHDESEAERSTSNDTRVAASETSKTSAATEEDVSEPDDASTGGERKAETASSDDGTGESALEEAPETDDKSSGPEEKKELAVGPSGESSGLGKSGLGRGGGGSVAMSGSGGALRGIGSVGGAGRGAARHRRSASPSRSAKGRPQSVQSGQLTAGEWKDHDHWGFWTGLYEQGGDGEGSRPWDWSQYEEQWEIYSRRRIPVVVSDGENPISDAPVELRYASGEVVWSARTDNRGRASVYAELFGGPLGDGEYTLVIGDGENAVQKAVEPRAKPYRIEIPSAGASELTLDLMLVVDTTGSMGDELSYLQSELESVVKRTRRHLDEDVDIRLSVNFYRDTGDVYDVKPNHFTTDIDKAVRQIGSVRAGGGGDFPEAVDRALVDAVEDHEWRQRADARLLFLVGDAPPHNGNGHVAKVHRALRVAAERGIRIIPVAGSGIDKSTEFLMRSMAIVTGGTYVFLTDDSGIGGKHIEPTIGDYDVHKLNDLLVAIAVRYLE